MTTKQITLDATREEAFFMYLCLKELAKIKLGAYMKFDVGHNISKLKDNYDLCEDIRNSNDDIENFSDYQKEVRASMLNHSVDGKVEGSAAMLEYEKDILIIREKFADVVTALDIKKEEFDKAINTTISISDLVVLPLDKFPEELEIDITPILGLIER